MTRRALSLLALAAALAPAAAGAQACPDPRSLTRGVPPPLAAVRYLADDALEGRLAGSPGERCAGEYIAAEFRRLGLEPAGEDGTFFQAVPLASALNPHAPGGTGRNVVARLPGADPALRAEAVVVGAHYDHLGHGGASSLAQGDSAVHNGADDNASGVAALLAVAERLARGPRPARTVVFVAFSGEELGLLGSAVHARQPAVPLERTRAMLNLDMVGRLGAGPLIVYGVETADEWTELVERAAAAEGVAVRTQGDGFGASDHTSFYVRDVPVLHFFTNVHADYHRPSDDWEKVDVAGMEKVSAIVARVASEVAGRPAALTFRRSTAPPPRVGGGTGGYGAYLGSVPDFAPVEYGVKLSGVRAGSPAEKAGLQAGDVIIAFDDDRIPDLQAMTNALRARRPGDSVRITAKRGDQEVTVTAVLGTRGDG
ncbi:MAG TPA: M20/M25/M40 family metallo-hydrolase [Longimicrobiaceae bacterium]|nr:M20/M25/M40 family metallo-hydrolase [Longimicrobiaceae bacterium]